MLRRLPNAWKSNSGLAGIEFALLLPLMVTLLLGTVGICNALSARQKVIDLSSNVSDLVAMGTSVNSTDISNAYSAGNAIMYPYSSANTTIVISSLVYSAATQKVTVAWSRAQNGTPLLQGLVVTPPAGVVATTDGASAILATVTYHYTPPLGFFGSIPMTFSFYSRPRESLAVTCNGC
ncbi:MAG TPA: TadE/TadG family type IV pilus assembly protein [Rhizomicrobium sp.]|nr:TadE/TadG family type IV pilus assembly protein [Rhizomicrobium sp.]